MNILGVCNAFCRIFLGKSHKVKVMWNLYTVETYPYVVPRFKGIRLIVGNISWRYEKYVARFQFVYVVVKMVRAFAADNKVD